MGTKRDENCEKCSGKGWLCVSYNWHIVGIDTESCMIPRKIQCYACDNDWSPLDDEASEPKKR